MRRAVDMETELEKLVCDVLSMMTGLEIPGANLGRRRMIRE